jgi:hypothetical protein
LAAVIWSGRVLALAVRVSIAAWQAAVTGELAEEVALDDALAVDDVAAFVTLAVGAEDVTAAVLTLAPALAVTVTVSVTVAVCVTVAVTVFVTVATGLAVVVGMRGTHSAMKVGSAEFTVATPVCNAAMASVAALTAAAGSVTPPPPPGPPVPPPDGVPVPDGAPLDGCDELVPVVAREVDVVAALVVLLELDDEAYVCWSVWYCEIADLYAASAARTALYNGVLLIEASA